MASRMAMLFECGSRLSDMKFIIQVVVSSLRNRVACDVRSRAANVTNFKLEHGFYAREQSYVR